MSRSLYAVSAAAMLAAAAHAQCLGPATGVAQTLTATATWPIHDEGRTLPAVALGISFPMAGAVGGPFTHAFIESNGELYLTNAALGLGAPVGPATYGIDDLSELRGGAGGNPRIVPFGGDNEAGNGGSWGIFLDTSVPGQCTVYWRDVQDFNGAIPAMSASFSATLYSTGIVDFSYGPTLPTGSNSFVDIFVGVSIGNDVGTGSTPPSDLSAGADSGSLGLLYEAWAAGAGTDLATSAMRFTPNGLGGFATSYVCRGAFHQEYGAGCYSDIKRESFFQVFADTAESFATLNGNSMTMTPTGTGYVVTWGGGTYMAPSGTATTLTLSDETATTVTPSVGFPHVDGTAAAIEVGDNGTVSMAASPSGNYTGWAWLVGDLIDDAVASFRCQRDYDPSGVGSGQVKVEEVVVGADTILNITFEGVYIYFTTLAETVQYQLNLTTGQVKIVWSAMAPAGDFTALMVGFSPGGISTFPDQIDLATQLPIVTDEDATLEALTLSASPAPVFVPAGPSVPITYQVDNLRDLSPALPGFYLATLVFSFNGPIIPGGIDLTLVGVDAPGCNLLVGTLDVLYNIAPTSSSHGEQIVVPQPLSPGTTFYVQAANFLIPNSLPNGQNNFGLIVSNGVESKFDLF